MKVNRQVDISYVKLLVLDVDGTLTDGKLYIGNNGELFKAFDVKDGCGIHDILPQKNIEPVIITARESDIVKHRCKELNINLLYQGVRNKSSKLEEICSQFGFIANENGEYKEVAYVGDDLVDIPVMKRAGLKACPADASWQVRELADIISNYNGGSGAVREIIEYICYR